MPPAAIQTSRGGILSRTVWADCASLKGIECLPAVFAFPESTQRRRGLAGRTNIAGTARQLRYTQQILRVSQAPPTVHQHEDRDGGQPHVLDPERQADEADDPHKTKNCRDHQTAT